jgi:hypothetical protein
MRRRTAATLAAAAATLGLAAGAAAEPVGVDLRVEAGTEYDTNIHRLEEADGEALAIESSPLLRLGARGRVGWRGGRERVRLDARASGKLHAVEGGGGEDVAVLAGDAAWEHRLGARAASGYLRASYYDALGFERSEPVERYATRNFRSVGGEGGVVLEGARDHRVTAGFGVQAFQLKADARHDWTGPTLRFGWQTTLWRGDEAALDPASIELSLAYRAARRGYDGEARTTACADGAPPSPACSMDGGLRRVDLVHGVVAEAAWTAERVYTLRYQLDHADSNSQGESYLRHRVELGATAEVVPDLYLTGEVAALYTVFLDALLVARDVDALDLVSIEDENRSSLTALASWRASPRTTVEARYALFSNLLAGDELTYRRQTFYLGLLRDL